MLIAERHIRMREVLARRGMCGLEALADELGVSASTVRRDLEAMEREGTVKRMHGGVIWTGDRTNAGPRPYAFDQRMGYQQAVKRRIAAAASKLVQAGQTVLIDGGTTTFYLAQELLGQSLQLVTNSLPIANLFLNDDKVELLLTGGLAYPRYGVLVGPMAESALASIHTKTMFLSVAGIHHGMLFNQNLLLVRAEQKMMEQAQEVVLLADAGKFGQQALVELCALGEIDTVVSDTELAAEQQQAVRAAGCRLILA